MADLLDVHALFALACKGTGKWGLFLSFEDDVTTRVGDYLNGLVPPCGEHLQALVDGHGALLFDTREEMERAYDSAPEDAYALTCSPEGQLLNENT